jgi:putative phosphoserine phosphatase/1-acylglycerol-3-phosphate O-acyltransferase
MSIAFFDIDGTLLAKPSLERRFFHELRRRGEIPAKNYFSWLVEMFRRGPRGFRLAVHANKMYLRHVSAEILSRAERSAVRVPELLPEFFPAALQRVWWHALRGDSIVLVSGTLAQLAEIVKFAVERELLERGVETKIDVLATQLEIRDGLWTGHISGPALFGEAKSNAMKAFANARQAPLSQCSAYGDSSLDRWMLDSVGHPFAINPTKRMRRIARLRGWHVLTWTYKPLRAVTGRRQMPTEVSDATDRLHAWPSWKKKDLAAR